MKARLRGAAGTVLAAVLLLGSLPPAIGQPPRDRDRDREGPRDGPRIDPAVEVWIKTLAEKITDRYDSIRDSAREGLVAVGPAALPTLRRIAEGNDGAAAEAARKLIGRIEGGNRVASGPGFPGGPRGPEGPGGPDRRGPGNQPGAGRPGDRPGTDRSGGDRPGAGRPDAGRAGGPMPFLTDAIRNLGLEEKQREKVRDIVEGHIKKMRELFERRPEPAQMREAVEKVRGELLKEMKEVLTKEQMEKFEKAVKDAPMGRPGGRPGPGGPEGRRPDGPRPGGDRPDRPGRPR